MEVCTIVFTKEHPDFEAIVEDAKGRFLQGVAAMSCSNEVDELTRLQDILNEHGIDY